MADGINAVDAFIEKWQAVTASELSTSQSFLLDLCTLLDVPAPHPTPAQDYMFERPITFAHGDGSTSAGRIDLYRRGAFVLESKKVRGALSHKGFDDALLRARSQAEAYARALPAEEGRPPFVVVVDVGHRIELYAEFTQSGATYTPFPDPRSHRLQLGDLRRPEVRDRLRRIWLDPLSLDPSREAARVTLDIADRLAALARSLEGDGHDAEAVAQFLMRCLFTMFAEDVRLLPADAFRDLLAKHKDQPDIAMRMLANLWKDMDTGGFSAAIAGDVLRFNGKLFKQPDVLPLNTAQVALLVDAARAKWEHVEPAIFGTLLERALSPVERHKLGAHYTPRAYVERLVLPTVIEPLRAEWVDAQAAAGTLAAEGKLDEAVAELLRFHHRLCTVRVLDPACGSGNFLYVTLEHLKRLEGEVLNALDELGHRQAGLAIGGERADAAGGETVDPHNLIGIEFNPRAAAIAEVVLWIGYLQWHFRTRGDVRPPIPVIRDFRNIENRDAVLVYDDIETVVDDQGVPVTQWDGRTMKSSPITGELVPDDSARVNVERFINPRAAAWPAADFVIGNPPFIGNKRMRVALGHAYVEALRSAWPDVPDSADFVMYWWHHAAQLARRGALQRFGLITTNSIRQALNRKIIENAMAPPKSKSTEQALSIVFAIPDHPWVDTVDGAAVRITMTAGARGDLLGQLATISGERTGSDGEVAVDLVRTLGRIGPDIRTGPDVARAASLESNRGLCWQGVKLVGDGFLVEPAHQGRMSSSGPSVIKNYLSNRDLVQRTRKLMVIDFAGLTVEEARAANPAAFQQVVDLVKPLRDENREPSRRLRWWLFGRSNENMRRAVLGLERFIVTPEVAKHRPFVFVSDLIPDASLYVVATNSASVLGVLSSTVHETWCAVAGGTLEDRPRYHNSTCFDRFPFPDLDEGKGARIARLAEQLDAHRKHQQAQYSELTLTGMYNVLDQLRAGEPLSAKERLVHEQGLVSVLRQLHDELDAAVLDAYGWSDLHVALRSANGLDAPVAGQTRDEAQRGLEESILARLVSLNSERALEEGRGQVRWLRAELRESADGKQVQAALTECDEEAESMSFPSTYKPQAWPKDTVEQVRAVVDVLASSSTALSLDEIAARFTARGPWKRRLPHLLEMLLVLGRAQVHEGRYLGSGA